MSATPPLSDCVAAVAARADNMMGSHACVLTPDQRMAWEGLLELGRVLRRDAEVFLDEAGVGVTALGVMGRLMRAPDERLRLTDLAESMGVSISRISRVIDVLERDGQVARTTCPNDGRATNIVLQPAGRTIAQRAQEQVAGFVDQAFLGRISDDECAVLARVFTRLIQERPVPGGCTGP